MSIDLEELAAIIELLDKTDFTQFRFEKGELRIEVSRGDAIEPSERGAAAGPTAIDPAAASRPAAPAAPSTPASAPTRPEAATLALAEDETLVRSPMLGTFYRSPKPGDPVFVAEGTPIETDSVLCIIEVMKLMNSVVAGEAGAVRRILAADGDLVEFDQPLFVIGPRA
ncbi:acetyl-CoA carboxylase biotin carboxyl carrier protein [Microbacterium sp. BWT-B31]|uniref:acetyl-CoA carboxylase biotin carboxyl carrier protein n=1 Tax=Microbacterium sp. BWT-B31 TaxID=3232072 RepID=UPI00352787CA